MKQPFLERPGTVKRIVQAWVICCIGLLVMDLVIHRHVVHPWEEAFGFYAFYGFGACVILVLLAREMRKPLMRDEDYYDPMEEEQKGQQEGKDD